MLVRLRKHVKREKLQKAAQANMSSEQIVAKRLSTVEEGDLFGIRAIQSGFYGGVAQSAPSSPMTSRAPSIYNQPTSPAGPLSGSSPYLPLMHPQAAASPITSTTSLPLLRSPLGLSAIGKDGQPLHNGSRSPSAMLRSPPRPGTSGSSRGFDQSRPSVERHSSGRSSGTINLDGLSPARHQQDATALRPSTSDASNTSPPSTKNGTSAGSRSSSFTSTYSYEDSSEYQPHNPTTIKPLEALPTIPILQPLSAGVNNPGQPQGRSSPPQHQGHSPIGGNSVTTSELPADSKTAQRDTNFSTPFRRRSQPEQMIPSNPEFGPLPAAAMNGGPLQFDIPRTQSPAPMSRGSPPRRTDSPMLFPPRGSSSQINSRSMSPDLGHQQPPRQDQMQRLGIETTPPPPNMKPSLPAFLQDTLNRTEVEVPQDISDGPRTAPLTKTSSSRLLPEMPKKNRLTADILNDFYDSYSYARNSKDDVNLHQSNQHFEMQRIPPPQSLPGSPRQGYRQPPTDRRLV